MNFTDEFFEFEIKNKLFDIIDNKGLRPWEAVRYWVYFNISHKGQGGHVSEPRPSLFVRLLHFINEIIFSLIYLLTHKKCEYLCIFSSRDLKDEEYYDKISDNLYHLLDKEKTIGIETYNVHGKYKYKGYTCSAIVETIVKYFVRCKFDFTPVQKLIQERFPGYDMNLSDLEGWYRIFVSQYLFYKFIFNHYGIRKVFMVQNGIHKGLFAAANELGIEVNEYQHGQISRNHLAYSYPDNTEITPSNIYHPTRLMLFGEFWGKGRVYPGVKNVTLGNDAYAESAEWVDIKGNKCILVISNREEGKMLAELVKGILNIDKEFTFYMKLHPNQYTEVDDYKNIFENYPNVNVITNDDTVNHLLSRSEAILVVQSTAELEALQAGRKVYVVKYGSYEFMDFVFNEPGVYQITNSHDFIESYNQYRDEVIKPRKDFFVRYNEDVAKSIIES